MARAQRGDRVRRIGVLMAVLQGTSIVHRAAPLAHKLFTNVNREPLCRPYRTWLGCCSPDKQAGSSHAPTDCAENSASPEAPATSHSPSIHRMTSADDSVVARIIFNVRHTAHQSGKNNWQAKMAKPSIPSHYLAFRNRN